MRPAMTLLVLSVVGIGGCGADRVVSRQAPAEAKALAGDARVGMTVAAAPPLAGDSAVAPPPGPGQSDRLPTQMIIRTGNVSIKVDSIERAVRLVTELATRSGGFLANAAIQTGENEARSATLEIKVPAERYDGAIEGLRAVGEIRNASTSSQDVGEEFVDVTARVSNARKLEDRLLNLLATRTGKLEEVLSVERELARVREEIERFEGRLRYLRSKVAMSTIVVNLFEPGPIVGVPGHNPILEAFRDGWRNLVSVVAGAIALSGGLVPLVLLGGGLAWLGRRWWRRQQGAPPA